jgi:hypothetical protein
MRETVEIVKCDICGEQFTFACSEGQRIIGELRVVAAGNSSIPPLRYTDICGKCNDRVLATVADLGRDCTERANKIRERFYPGDAVFKKDSNALSEESGKKITVREILEW